ncbi:hypothetical protein ACQR3P_30710 [Rhodococcus sp. IEGM1300]
MNHALVLSNAIAMAVVLGLHYAPQNGTETVAQRMPHYLQLQKAPQLAVMNDRSDSRILGVREEAGSTLSQSSERWIF